jgi:hypothetical protein
MFAHKSVLHLSSQRALARMAKTLSFHNNTIQLYKKVYIYWPRFLQMIKSDVNVTVVTASAINDLMLEKFLLELNKVKVDDSLIKEMIGQASPGVSIIKLFFSSFLMFRVNHLERLSLLSLLSLF